MKAAQEAARESVDGAC